MPNPTVLMDKLRILTDAAKYDVACTSSGLDRKGQAGGLGSAVACGICHSFAADGRCISLLKVLMSNACAYNCSYCVNRRENDVPRATFTPRELADLTIEFYKRNYIEGLFLSSAVVKNPDYTCERMLATLRLLREEYRFGGYIHAKAIPGADPRLIQAIGALADRMSVNIELPSQKSLNLLAPEKKKEAILAPMAQIREGIAASRYELARYAHAPRFAPAGQSTQLIIGATPETDRQILLLSAALYKKYALKRVFYSAYMPVVAGPNLPALGQRPPLLREHRLYQADWLLRYYGFAAEELLDEAHPNFHPLLDPKCNWALNHMEQFPVEVNRAPLETLLRVPGVGVKSARRIVAARRTGTLTFESLKKLGVVLKRLTVTLSMGGCSLLISTGLGILLGFVAAECHGRWPDNLICVFSGAGTAMPPFLTAIVMILIFSVGLGLLPVQGYTDPSVDFWDHVRKMILPCMVASFGGMMTVIRQTRASLLETVNKDFIRTAIAKGLRRRDIRLRHLLRNAILPVLSLLGMQVGVLFGGMVVVENIFNVPGMGSLVVTAVKNRDVPLIQMCILVMAVAMVLSTLAVDIAYGLIDPRMREVRADK